MLSGFKNANNIYLGFNADSQILPATGTKERLVFGFFSFFMFTFWDVSPSIPLLKLL